MKITIDTNRRVCAMEHSTNLTLGDGPDVLAVMDRATGMEGTALRAALEGDSGMGTGEGVVAGNFAVNPPSVEKTTTADRPSGLMSFLGSPKWSQVENAVVKSKSRLFIVTPRQKERSGNVMPIVGTGAMGNIKMVKTRLVNVLDSKFTPDLDAITLSEFLKDKLGHEVICQKIDTVHGRYSSFKYLLNVMWLVKCTIQSSGQMGHLLGIIMMIIMRIIRSNTAPATEGTSVPVGNVNTQ